MIKKISLILAVLLSLQGCAIALVGGVIAGGTAIYNRKAIKTYYQDSNIEFAIQQRLQKQKDLKQNTHIVVVVYKGIVLLAGEVNTPAQRITVQQTAQGIPGVKRIYNELKIAGTISTLVRADDKLIMSKVKTEMLLCKQLKSRYIKIVTVNGTVFLMGDVSDTQAKLATDITRKVSGVQRVVTLFQIVS